MALSFVSYVGDGTTTSFNVTFPYINKTDVSVTVDEVDTSFTWLSSATISVSPAPASNSSVKIKRSTNQSSLEVDFVDAAVLTESDLDKANQQNFYLSQEAKDDSDIALKQNSTGNWEGQNKTLQNLGTPVNGTDAVNKTYIDTQTNNAFTSATNASTSEANALASANSAASSLDHFTDRYLGASATEPTTDLDGNTLLDGAMFWNTSDNIMYTYDLGNTSWVRIKPNATEQSNINSAVANASDISTAASNINDIRNFSEVYRISATAPTSSLNQGDLWWDSTANELKAYSAGTSAWQSTAPSTTSQNNINIVAGDVVHAEDMGSIADALTTESGNGDITTCATNISTINSCVNNISQINNVGNNISSVTNLSGISSDVSNLSGISSAVSNLSNVSSSITAVNNISSDVTAVAGKAAQVELLGTSSNVSAMSTLGTSQVVSDLSACATNATDISTVAGVASGVSFFSDRYRVGANAPTTSLDSGDLWWDETNSELKAYSGSAWQATAPSAVNQQHINNVSGAIVYSEDLGSIGDSISTSSSSGDIATVSNAIDEVSRLGTAQAVSDLQTLGTTANVGHLQTVSGSISHVQTVSGSIADVNRYSEEYTIASSAPSSPSAGDLWYDSSANVLKYRTNTTWSSLTAGIAEISQDTSPELSANLDCANFNISNCGTLDGSNLQIDFGSIA